MSEHLGISHITGKKVTKPTHSSIMQRASLDRGPYLINQRAIRRVRPNESIRLYESVFIRYLRDYMNPAYAAFPLFIT